VLNLSEGTARVTDTEKKQYFTMARGSVFECVTLLHLVYDLGQISESQYTEFYNHYEKLSKMLLGMYRSKL
jgi:four helix bundle protein